jgi:hypothetical protein
MTGSAVPAGPALEIGSGLPRCRHHMLLFRLRGRQAFGGMS